MPDRLPPSWGHEPVDGRDLDALLSAEEPLSVEEIQTDEALLAGQLAGISDSQRPVAGAMFALRSAPVGSELAGEAAARAAFRALIAPAGPVSAGPVSAGSVSAGPVAAGTALAVPVPAGRGAAWSRGDSGGAEVHHTLVLPVPAAGQGPRPPARHRRRRQTAGGRGGWRVMALAGSAAAVVAVGAAALAGTFGAGHGGQSANPSASQLSPRAGVSPSGTQVVLGGGQAATKGAKPSPTPTASAMPGMIPRQGALPTPADLCSQLISLWFQHPHGDKAKIGELIDELGRQAGSPEKIAGYCAQQLYPAHAANPLPTSWAGYHFQGNGGHDGRADSGSGSDQQGSGQATSGPGGSGSGNGGSH